MIPLGPGIEMTDKDLVAEYFKMGLRLTFWPQIGDVKGPQRNDWQHEQQPVDDYRDGYRVGIFTGVEIAPGKIAHDIDIDWAAGAKIATAILPHTSFVYGRVSKPISHAFVTLPEAVPTVRYEDPIDKVCLIELRGSKSDGTIGMQSMAPPSIWTKDGQREELNFVRFGYPTHHESALIKARVCHAAIAMLLAKYFGYNGFGHEARLCWAGFLLRAGIEEKDLIRMGEAISIYCNNREVYDVAEVVESTVKGLAKDGKKIKGGPALKKLLGKDHGAEIIDRINEWIGHGDFQRVEGKIVKDSQTNICRAVEQLHVTLSHNEFAERMLIQEDDGPKRRLEDGPLEDLWLRIDREFHFRPSFDFFQKVIHHIARENAFHPVSEYLDGLTWDGKPRIDEWLIKAASAEDTEYVRAISAIMLIAAVRRIRQPGCKYDELVIWESPQGTNKSGAAQTLCPEAAWFSDDLRLNLHSKELIEATLGKWIIEASDLAGRRKTEIEQLKAMLSRQTDGPARMAYAHEPVERPRHFIIIGTTNSSVYLNDPTGDRRFWPVAIKRFDLKWIKENRDQLWAEACVREAKKESIRLKEELWPAATKEQEKRREVDPWEDLIRAALLLVEPNGDRKRRVATDALWAAVGVGSDRRDRAGGRRISEIMQRLGFGHGGVRVAGEKDPVRGYISNQVDDPALNVKEDDRLVGGDDDEVQELPDKSREDPPF